jgi:hypothetical protein
MKRLLFLFSFLVLFASFTPPKNDYGVLLRSGEKVLYAFTLKSGKTAVVATQEDNNYIVYRFGSKDNVELQYPADVDETSWQTFHFDGYHRGGANNDPVEEYSLSFKNGNATYKIFYSDYKAEHDKQTAIFVGINGKTIKLQGIPHSIKGSLGNLMYMEDLIHNYHWDDGDQ